MLGIKSINEDEILKGIIKYYFEDSKKYEELFKFANEEFIINLFNNTFGSSINNASELPEVFKSAVFTYFATSIKDIKKVERYAKYILKNKATNVYVFINSLMRDKTTKDYFETISNEIVKEFGIEDLISRMDIEEYKNSDSFKVCDSYILKYITGQLNNGIGEFNKYIDLIDIRQNKYWYDSLEKEYSFLRVAINFFKKMNEVENTITTTDIDSFTKNYTENLCEIDTLYRKMYYYFDSIEDKDIFIDLKDRIENIYVNDFISELSIKWSDTIEELTKYNSSRMTMQDNFYKNYVRPFKDKKDRVIVIISDAFRYECAKELENKLKVFAKESKIEYMQGLVPSYTKLGMASLLPHKELSRVKDSDDILVDGNTSSSIKDRQTILQKENEDSIITIGRSQKCDIIIEDMMLSKIQAYIEYNSKTKKFYLNDGDEMKESTNGTWVFILKATKITNNFMFKAEHTLFLATLNNN